MTKKRKYFSNSGGSNTRGNDGLVIELLQA